MENEFIINGKKYLFVSNYKDTPSLRASFNQLTTKTFCFDFESWYKEGYWQDRYIPYSLLDGDRIVSNVSVNIIDFDFMGTKKRMIQLGTVMTDDAYRNQGLSRVLMEKIIDELADEVELIYLFANDSVVNFYPKFGFVITNEYQYSKHINLSGNQYNVKKLDMSAPENKALVYSMANNRNPFSAFSMINNASLVMFYCIGPMQNDVYYIEEYDTVAIAQYDGENMHLLDLFGKRASTLDDVIQRMAKKDTKKVILGFTPMDSSSFDKELLVEDDCTFFVRTAKKEHLFQQHEMMFPVLSHA